MADTIDFYLVEEGIKRNKHSVSLLEDVGLMIWNRAHAELSYLQEIDKWKDKVMAEDTDGDNRGVLDFVKPALIGEADRAAEIHKSIYDKLMARKGPYQNILKCNKQNQEKNKKSKLKEIEEEFNNCNARRKDLEYQVQKQKQSIEKTALQLSEFEQKLSKRSRITDGRRSARGMRKLDSINAQVSLFRKRIETTSASCSRDEAELQSLIICKSKMLKKMFQDLRDMDEQRLAAIHGVMQQYVQEIRPPYDLIRERSDEISEATKSLQSLNIGEIHNQNWQLTEDRARLKKAGLKMGFDMFLVNNPSYQVDQVQQLSGNTESGKAGNSRPPSRREQHAQQTDSLQSLATRPSSSGATVNTAAAMKGPVMRVEADDPVDEDNLELDTVVLPGDNNRRLPTPVTVRGFLVNQEKPGPSCLPETSGLGRTEEEEVPIIQVDSGEESSTDNSDENADLLNNERDNEDLDEGFDDPTFSENRVIEFDPQTVRFKYSRMSTLPEPETTPPTVVDGDIGTLRNIRVIANRDYKAHNCNELNLKKGQVIKQKIGENEEGYAYGWTREGKLSSKQYGWYPISVVSYK